MSMEHQEAVATHASERYLLNEMSDAERDAFEDHYFSCVECADDVKAGARMEQGVREGLASAQVIPIKRSWRQSTVLPWAVAATFAFLATYETLHTRTQVADGSMPIAVPLNPVTIRPATRGQEAVIRPEANGSITLAFDVDSKGTGSIRYTLRHDDGTAVTSGEMPSPPPGGVMLLFFAPGALTPSNPSNSTTSTGRYILATQKVGSADLTEEEYRFRVEAR
jgi:hypothetical protein